MTSRRFMYAAGAVAILLGALILAVTPGTRAQEVDGNYGIGIPDVFLPKYLAFRTGQVASGSPDVTFGTGVLCDAGECGEESGGASSRAWPMESSRADREGGGVLDER